MNPAWNDARRLIRNASRSRVASDEDLVTRDDIEASASEKSKFLHVASKEKYKTYSARDLAKVNKGNIQSEFTRSASAAVAGQRRVSDPVRTSFADDPFKAYGATDSAAPVKAAAPVAADGADGAPAKAPAAAVYTNGATFNSLSDGLHDIDSDHSGEDNSPDLKEVDAHGHESLDHRSSSHWLIQDLAVFVMMLQSNYFLSAFLVFIPLGFAAYSFGWSDGLIFSFNFLAIIPLAWLLGNATEELALRTNPTLGGLLNASFGNAVELIVSVIALRKGYIKLVQTSLLGSILSNMLLVLGMSFFLGGLHYRQQNFNRKGAQIFSSMLLLACLAISIPSAYVSSFTPTPPLESVLHISRVTALLVFSAYISYLFFQLYTHQDVFDSLEEDDEEEESQLTLGFAILMLVAVTVCVALCSEFLVDAIEPITKQWNINESFVGIILIPIVGNAAEHATAVTVAMKNKLDLSIGVAIGSSTQISLFLIPFITLLGWALDQPMTLNFTMFETVVLVLSVLIVNFIVKDGEANWLVGLMLMCSYFIIGTAYYYHPNTIENNGDV